MSHLNWRNCRHVIRKPLFWRKVEKQSVCYGITTIPSVQITQTPLKLHLTKFFYLIMIEIMIWRQWGGLCRHYWTTFLIIPLVLLICLWLIKCGPKLLRSLYSLRCEIHNNWQKSISFFFSESEIVQRFQNCSGFCCSSNETKTTEAVSFFLYDLLY